MPLLPGVKGMKRQVDVGCSSWPLQLRPQQVLLGSHWVAQILTVSLGLRGALDFVMDFTRMRSFNIVFSVTPGTSPSHRHDSVISGKMWGAAWQCGIVPQDLWLGFNKWPFIRFVLPSAGGYVPTQFHWDIWEHLLSDGFSVMSPRFLCISFQPWLARSWQDSADGMLF